MAECSASRHRPAAEARARGITMHQEGDEPLMVHGDAHEREIIFNNLLSNAVKYNRDGGRVDVQLKRNDAAVSIAAARG